MRLEEFNENPADKNKKDLWKAVKKLRAKFTPRYIQMKNKERRLVPLNKRAEGIADYLEKEHWSNPTRDGQARRICRDKGHDDLVRDCLNKLLEQPRPLSRHSPAWQTATLPLRSGGCGLRSAARTAPAAYWAAWADALSMLRARNARWADTFCAALQDSEGQGAQCLREAAAAGAVLDSEGWVERPSWTSLLAGARPQQLARQTV